MDRDLGGIGLLTGLGQGLYTLGKGAVGVGQNAWRLAGQHGPGIARSIGRWVKPTPGKWGWVQPGLDAFGGAQTYFMDRGEGVSKSDAAKHAALNFGANVAFNPLDPYGIVSMGSSFVPEIMEGIHYLRTGKGDEEAPIVNRLANTFRFANPSSWAAGISDKLGDETRSIPFTTSIDPGDRDERLNLIFKTKDALKTNLLNLGWSDKGANEYLDTHQNYDDRYKALKDTHAYFNYNLVNPQSEAGRLLLQHGNQ